MSSFGERDLSGMAEGTLGRGRGVDTHRGQATPDSRGTVGLSERPAAGVLVRLSVRLRRHILDRQLALGRDPDTSAELMLRAWQLVQPSSRRAVAQAVRRVVHRAEERRPNGLTSVAPVSREAVIGSREGLLGVADAIEHSEHARACGVARALGLITDVSGPLFNPAQGDLLGPAIWAVADGLRGQTG